MTTACPKCHHGNLDDGICCGKCALPLQPSKDFGIMKTIDTAMEEYPRGRTFADRYKALRPPVSWL